MEGTKRTEGGDDIEKKAESLSEMWGRRVGLTAVGRGEGEEMTSTVQFYF